MIQVDLLDRTAYCIGGEWCVHEILCIVCPKCGQTTVEIITYPEMTLYYHTYSGGGPKIELCTVGKGTYRVPRRLQPWFEAQPLAF